MTNWLDYFEDEDRRKAPFLLARLVSPSDRLRRPVFLDAKLDTGSSCCAVPEAAVAYCQSHAIPVVPGLPETMRSAFGSQRTPTYWFHVTICASSAPRTSLTEDQIVEHFQSTHPLYCTRRDPSDFPCRGLNMVLAKTSYALVGQNVLKLWTVILHGQSAQFKVLDRGCKRFIFSWAPKPPSAAAPQSGSSRP